MKARSLPINPKPKCLSIYVSFVTPSAPLHLTPHLFVRLFLIYDISEFLIHWYLQQSAFGMFFKLLKFWASVSVMILPCTLLLTSAILFSIVGVFVCSHSTNRVSYDVESQTVFQVTSFFKFACHSLFCIQHPISRALECFLLCQFHNGALRSLDIEVWSSFSVVTRLDTFFHPQRNISWIIYSLVIVAQEAEVDILMSSLAFFPKLRNGGIVLNRSPAPPPVVHTLCSCSGRIYTIVRFLDSLHSFFIHYLPTWGKLMSFVRLCTISILGVSPLALETPILRLNAVCLGWVNTSCTWSVILVGLHRAYRVYAHETSSNI